MTIVQLRPSLVTVTVRPASSVYEDTALAKPPPPLEDETLEEEEARAEARPEDLDEELATLLTCPPLAETEAPMPGGGVARTCRPSGRIRVVMHPALDAAECGFFAGKAGAAVATSAIATSERRTVIETLLDKKAGAAS